MKHSPLSQATNINIQFGKVEKVLPRLLSESNTQLFEQLLLYPWAEMQGPPGQQGSGIDQEQDPLWNTRVGTCTAAHNLEVCYFTSCLYLAYEIKNQQLYFSPKVLEVLCGKAGACPLEEQHLFLFHSNVNIVPSCYSLSFRQAPGM